MATLENKRDIPPGGWNYVERETGQRFSESSFEDVLAKATAHRKYRNLPTDGLALIIEDQICLGLDAGFCRAAEGEDYVPVPNLTQRLNKDMAVAANAGLLEFVKGGLAFNDPAEAKARADICRTCPFNTPASSCSCNIIYKTLDLLMPSSRKPAGISVCMACGCSLTVKVNMPAEVVTASLRAGQPFPKWCWQNSLLPLDAPSSA